MKERISNPERQAQDHDHTLRPQSIAEFIGQELMKENTSVYIQAAKKRKDVLDHILLHGPPGLGKTTFAHIIANEMKTNIKITSAPVIEKTGDLASILTSLKEYEILFIDEIHRLKPVIEEILYPAMEDFSIDIMLGQGPTAKSVRIKLNRFTLIGATTKAGLLTQPLIGRFGIINRFDFYSKEELTKIIKRNVKLLNISVDESGIDEISKRSRGTPRVLNRIIRRIRDFAQVKNQDIIDRKIADYALGRMEIDGCGLDSMDRKILSVIIKNFQGGPVGLDNLAISVGEDTSTIEDVYEPYLIQSGFLKRTPRGRVATVAGYKHLGLKKDSNAQLDLFTDSNS
ncbi:Holliday junction branch migration DNA helicase RuvB [Spirochaetota bacterium]